MKKIYKILIIAFSLLSLGTGLGFGIDALETQYLQNEYAEFKGDDFYKTMPINAKFRHYNGGVAIYYDRNNWPDSNSYYIEEYHFYFYYYNDIFYYKENEFYLLKDAYNSGLIDLNDVRLIHKRYKKYFEKRFGFKYNTFSD